MELLPASFNRILTSIFDPTSSLLFVDVGAYQGDFTRSLIGQYPTAQGILFEPTPQNFQHLQNIFLDSERVRVLNIALSDSIGSKPFYTCDDSATNSLLEPISDSQLQASPFSFDIHVETLDHLLLETNYVPFEVDTKFADNLQLIKIDTQGNDLNVLNGCLQILQISKPLVLVEVVFSKLYTDQANYYSILDFFKQKCYALAGIFNIHYSFQGMIAYADFFFVPQQILDLHPQLIHTSQGFTCLDGDYWIRQAQIYEKVCAERLSLINELSHAAEERLQLIKTLDAEVKRLNDELTQKNSQNS